MSEYNSIYIEGIVLSRTYKEFGASKNHCSFKLKTYNGKKDGQSTYYPLSVTVMDGVDLGIMEGMRLGVRGTLQHDEMAKNTDFWSPSLFVKVWGREEDSVKVIPDSRGNSSEYTPKTRVIPAASPSPKKEVATVQREEIPTQKNDDGLFGPEGFDEGNIPF